METLEDIELGRHGDVALRPGALVYMHSSRHRLLAVLDGRALLTDVRTHHPWLVQDEDGSLQLPPCERVLEMMRTGEASYAEAVGPGFSPTEKLKFEIDLLDEHGVRQGDKSIWQFLARAWTPDLVDRFGPHDDPWRIRRWRAALRKAGEDKASS